MCINGNASVYQFVHSSHSKYDDLYGIAFDFSDLGEVRYYQYDPVWVDFWFVLHINCFSCANFRVIQKPTKLIDEAFLRLIIFRIGGGGGVGLLDGPKVNQEWKCWNNFSESQWVC